MFFCGLIFLSIGCEAKGLQGRDGDVGAAPGGPSRGPAGSIAADAMVPQPDASVADVPPADQRAASPDLSPESAAPDVRSPAEAGAEVMVDVVAIVVPDSGIDVGREAGPDLTTLPDLRSVLPEAGPEAKKCASECFTGCNIGCRSDGQCQACATCTCEVASGTCHC